MNWYLDETLDFSFSVDLGMIKTSGLLEENEYIFHMRRTWILVVQGSNVVIWMCMKSEAESHSVVADFLRSHGLYSLWNSLGQNTGVGSLSLDQRIFPIQGRTQVLHIEGGFFTSWAKREYLEYWSE